MSDTTQEHWQRVYATRASDAVSWFQEEAVTSLAMIAAAGLGPEAAVIDVGAGASTLVDQLLGRGFQRITLLDVSDQALDVAKARLGVRSGLVDWVVANITHWTPASAAFDLWHDRAVFHFLTDETDRQAYLRALNRGLRVGGHVVLATFAPTGPERCSGLPVRRYSAEALRAAFGPGFELVETRPQVHRTPTGSSQDFVWCLLRRRASYP